MDITVTQYEIIMTCLMFSAFAVVLILASWCFAVFSGMSVDEGNTGRSFILFLISLGFGYFFIKSADFAIHPARTAATLKMQKMKEAEEALTAKKAETIIVHVEETKK